MSILPKVTDLAAVRARGAAKQARGGTVRPGGGLRMRLPRRYAKFYSFPRLALTQRVTRLPLLRAFATQFGLLIVWLALSAAFWVGFWCYNP